MVRRQAPYSFNAAAREFCRSARDSLPTSREAVACPNFSEAARRSSSSQCWAIRWVFSRRVSSGPAVGQVLQTCWRGAARYRVIFPRSRIRGGELQADQVEQGEVDQADAVGVGG